MQLFLIKKQGDNHMSNHFKGLNDNSNKNLDGSDHQNSGQSSNSRGFNYKTWLRVVQGDDSNKIDLAAPTASTKIDTELWEDIDRETSLGEIPKSQSDSPPESKALETLRAVKAKQGAATQNTSTDYTSFFINSMKSFLSAFTPKTSEILTQTTSDTSSLPQNNNPVKRQTSFSSKQDYRSIAINNSLRITSDIPKGGYNKSSPKHTLRSSPTRTHSRSDSATTQNSSGGASEYSLEGRGNNIYGVESPKSDSPTSRHTTESAIIQSTRSLWENLRHPTNTDITKEERKICEKHAPDLVKNILNAENPPGLSKLQKDFKQLKADLINGKRAEVGFTKLTEGIRSQKFKALLDEEKDIMGLNALEIPEKQKNLKDIKRSLKDIRDAKVLGAQSRRDALEKEFINEKAIFDQMTAQYNQVNNKLQAQIKEALEQNEGYKDSKSKFEKALTNVLDQMKSVKEEIEKAGNGENSQLYIDNKVKLFKKLLIGGKLAPEQRSLTGLSTREQGLNVALDLLPEGNSAEGRSELIEYYVREHINFLTAYKNSDKYEFTEEHKDKLLAAMIRNAQNLETLLGPIKLTDKAEYSEDSQKLDG